MFEKVKIYKPGRSAFRLSYNNRTSQNIGEVVPSMAKMLMPGDTFRFGQVATVELQPMIAPSKGDLWLESCAFFVPMDILKLDGEEKFTDILVGQSDYQKAVPVPVWELDKTDLDSDGKLKSTHYNTLWDKFGFPLNLPPTISDEVTPCAYLQRGYNSIYNEWIRDENSDEEVPLTSNELQTCCYKKDYFTSVFDSPQHGDAPTLPLSGSASAEWSEDLIGSLIGVIVNAVKMSASTNASSGNNNALSAETELSVQLGASANSKAPLTVTSDSTDTTLNKSSKLKMKVTEDVLALLNENSINLDDLITFNIDDLRLLNKLQKWLERTQLCGTRTKEFLLANYGIAPNDETLQRPVFLGRLRTPIQISSNISSVESGSVPQGHKTGNATGQNAVLFKKWTCKEPGIIYIVSFVRPKATYQQGISREWILRDIFDYPNPIFQDLGQQAVLNAEIYCQGTDDDLGIAGYQENYVHFKTSNDITTGRLRINSASSGELNLEQWSIQRKFASLPDLTSTQFLHVDPKDYAYLFAYQFEDAPTNSKVAPQMVITYSNVIKAVRPLHKRALPSL